MHFYTIQSKKGESRGGAPTSETYGSKVTGKDGNKMAGKLEGKIALVTGGGTGIGLATAQRFAKEGAYVYITGRRQSELDKAVKSIGGSAKAVQTDVSKLSDLDKLFAQIKQEKGRVDVVFANAGVVVPGLLGEITEEAYDKTFDINVKGVLFTVQKALGLMPDGGSILINASVVSSKGFPALSVYSATKAALRSFARTWTTDLKARKIRVNVVSPGPIETPALDGLAKNEEERKAVVTQLTSGVPLGRMGEPDEIAKAALFLASDDSSFVAGVELFVDGGTEAV
jgi:NAD(P)-dependent dehydrogenase (short-subunit alcohol dehydrogenase family)